MSKRIGFITLLALVLVLGLTTMAFAAQNSDYSGSATDGVNDFSSTPKYQTNPDGTVKTDANGNPLPQFNADGKANYPSEIYLPNEQDPANYRIHSNYAQTTDACASCHSTHTATGEALLQWGTVYDTCMACHDGSVSTTYDVKGGKIGNTGMPTFGGVFGDAYTDPSNPKSLSNHNVTGAMSIYAAPGGPGTPGLEAPSWDAEFGCQSCHSPHGMGGNARILNPDVNGAAMAAYNKGAYNADASLVAQAAWTDSAKMTKIAVDGNNIGGSKNVPLLKAADGTYYTNWRNVQKVTRTGTPKVVTAVATDPSVKDQWLWSARPYKNNVKIFKNGSATALASTEYTLDNTAGYTKITFTTAPSDTDTFTADFVPAIKVQMNITDYLKSTENVAQVSGLNNFCGACHTDYNTAAVDGPHATLNGTYTEAYRHKVGFDRASSATALGKLNMKLESNLVTCETCHTAHGVDSDYWKDSLLAAQGTPGVKATTLPVGFEEANLKEIAGSSALKRLPNMATCEACHAKGLANQGYAALSGSTSTQTAAVTGSTSGGGFVGQAACASCHGELHKEYNKTWHPEMSRPGLSPETLADIQKPENAAKINTLLPFFIAEAVKANAETAKVGYDEKGAVKLEPAAWAGKGVIADNIKIWTTGTEYGQEIMARGDLVGAPAGSEKNWYIVLYKQGTAYTPVAPVDANGAVTAAGLVSDQYCDTGGCHTTGVNVNGGYQGNNVKLASTAAFTTGWLEKVAAGQKPDFELGITCEACHGQGGNHVKEPSSKNIVNPATYTLAQQSAGAKATLNTTTNKWAVAGDRFLNTAASAKSCGTCHSGKHQGDFFSTQTYNDFDGVSTGITVNPSKMYLNDAVSCVTCHDSHSDAVKGQLNAPTADQLCASCHGAGAIDLTKAMPAYPRSSVLHRHNFAVKN